MIFDQYSRYFACAKMLEHSGLREGLSLLDVGSGPDCLFGNFLPDAKITYVDPLIANTDGQYIQGNIFSRHLDGRSFSAAVAVDVFEHISPDNRHSFLQRITQLSSDAIILGFPNSDTPDSLQTDLGLEQQFLDVYGTEYPWLKEHHEYGLPSLAETRAVLENQGWYCQSVGHGHTPWLRELLGFVLCAWEQPAYRDLILSLSERFNRELAPYDFTAPCYRQFIIATRQPVAPFQPPETLLTITEANRAFRELMQYVQTEYLRLTLNTPPEVQNELIKERDITIEERNVAIEERDKAIKERNITIEHVEKIKNSSSWRLTKPMRLVFRIARYGITEQDRQQFIRILRYRYQRLPLPVPVRRLLSYGYHRILRRFLQLAARRIRIWSEAEFQAPAFKPVSQNRDKSDYIVWGVIDWHFRHQRPQQLASALAATGRRVFYASPLFVDKVRAGFEAEALDDSDRLFQIKLFAQGAPIIYTDGPSLEIVRQLRRSIGEVLAWADCNRTVNLVDHPFWLDTAAVVPNSSLVYDCMDHHDGFGNNSEPVLQLEKRLLAEADLTVTASTRLQETTTPLTGRSVMIRNAGDYIHFSQVPEDKYRDPKGRRVIGYYGAIAEWFDLDLIQSVAIQHPGCCLLLIGADTVNAKSKLSKLGNVIFTGEVAYSKLPYYLHGFDVCLLPFKKNPLTLATNPVKIYEYLSAGKPVVSIDLPEMAQFADLVYTAANHDSFLASLRDVLDRTEAEDLIRKRKEFAQGQTWQHRTEALIQQAEACSHDPKVSVIIVTYNNLNMTQACLSSLEQHSRYQNLEIIIVDNASGDGSPAYLSEWAAGKDNRKLILNEDNRGFAAANNQGLEVATGNFLVLLNNDTYVTPGWLRTLIRHIERDQTIGLIGPVTNNIGNEAKIDIAYKNMEEMQAKAAAYTRKNIGNVCLLKTAAFFCVIMPRSTYERVGKLDEAFGRGFFEDDDYCRRVEQQGLRIVYAEDVFVHHHLSASFNKLDQKERQTLFEENKKVYEAKWGKWIPHKNRLKQERHSDGIPEPFKRQKYIAGACIACGKSAFFFYSEAELWRESLNCQHCLTTSRYRSITRGLLLAIKELTGVDVPSLEKLPQANDKQICIYDTQPPFYYASCAYPLPDLLKKTGWIDVKLSQFKPKLERGETLAKSFTNQNLECLTYPDNSFDIVITSDVMEHVRLDDRAHNEIYRVLKPGGIYLFTVPHDRTSHDTLTRVQVTVPDDPDKDVYLLEPEYHGDTNNDEGGGVLAYRVYGRDLETFLSSLGFHVEYIREDMKDIGIMNTELYFCRKVV